MDAFFGLAICICLGLLVFGMVKRFPWFIIRGAMVNGPGLLAALYGVFFGISYGITGSGAWWLLAIVGAFFVMVCGYNLYNFFNGSEAEMFRELVAEKIRERQEQQDNDS